jgi:hypothetical protein
MFSGGIGKMRLAVTFDSLSAISLANGEALSLGGWSASLFASPQQVVGSDSNALA